MLLKQPDDSLIPLFKVIVYYGSGKLSITPLESWKSRKLSALSINWRTENCQSSMNQALSMVNEPNITIIDETKHSEWLMNQGLWIIDEPSIANNQWTKHCQWSTKKASSMVDEPNAVGRAKSVGNLNQSIRLKKLASKYVFSKKVVRSPSGKRDQNRTSNPMIFFNSPLSSLPI